MTNNLALMNKINTVLLLHSERLSNWERDYLSNLNQTVINHGQLSEKQLGLFEQILVRRKITKT
ncbi:hypothetical protein UB37_13990 [Photobacterium iliopiscarium]|uniref:Uncharacterized protein n=1 Tax=Photobacterium iliopiscarium TaxID=56192 RepID=A0A0D8PNN8_9GAMM|nr:hypothetical protein [Photobacterium iliopiscarium]KJG14906.1 hypothetical protein UB38_00880 [Photobacterium iliopiscarium]KJG20571.1 hypothetical protein UB37_13990 [Photobacterium iliopiscarium]MCD9468471.1 hypothetical protein [Photobacterium iliopiscarium]MCD9488489.1 hypothetical protein [Photobacterium iliopiscarium]MCF2245252.1 hypothetical protein [Photobacterium iliopiscarium]